MTEPPPAPEPIAGSPKPVPPAPPEAATLPAPAKPAPAPARRTPAAPAPAASAPATPPPAAALKPAPPPVAEPDTVARAVEAALPAMERGQFDVALAGLQSALGEQPTSPSASQARLLIARIYDRQGRTDAALAAYADLRATYPKDPASADALLRMADLVQKTRQPDRMRLARSYLDQIVANFPTTSVAPRALAQRAAIEEREDLKVTDPVLQRVVPAALVSYRQLTEAYPQAAPAEAAFIRLARFYDDMKRYDLQAQALTALGSYLPEDTARRVVGSRRGVRAAPARRRQGERRVLARADDVAALSGRAEEVVGALNPLRLIQPGVTPPSARPSDRSSTPGAPADSRPRSPRA